MNMNYLIYHCSLNVMYVCLVRSNILSIRSCSLFILLLLSTWLVVVLVRVQYREGRVGKKRQSSDVATNSFVFSRNFLTDRFSRGTCPLSPTGCPWRLRGAAPSGYTTTCFLASPLSLLSCLSSSWPAPDSFAWTTSNAERTERLIAFSLLECQLPCFW